PHAWTLIGSGGSESPAVTQPSAGQGSAQNSPVLSSFLSTLKVSAVDQHGRKSGYQPLTTSRGQVYHSDLRKRQK
ncbi:hypothetical protein JOQ06_006678, partial [Pogonophryne albipinna]